MVEAMAVPKAVKTIAMLNMNRSPHKTAPISGRKPMMMVMMNNMEAAEEAVSATSAPAQVDEEKIPTIPDRMYFRIGDVAEIAGVQPYVLRFWEKEFSFLNPVKNNSGQRIYRRSDVESVLLIKRLLYQERYSIEGAKKRINELRKQGELAGAKRARGTLDDRKIETLVQLRQDLADLIELTS
jgi:DNA-binding transcriptional MerR regulator